MYFKSDLHVHSIYSKDSKNKINDIVKICKMKNIDCIAVTDHNTIKGSEKIRKFIKRKNLGIRTITSSEIKTNLGDVIGYHITDEIKPMEFACVVDEIKSQGGYVCIPHAFDFIRNGVNPKGIRLRKIDFLELNARSLWIFNKKTKIFSKIHKIKLLASSDAHTLNEIGKFHTFLDSIEKIKPKKIEAKASIFYPLYPLIRTKLYKSFNL